MNNESVSVTWSKVLPNDLRSINFQTGCSFLSLLSMSHYGHWCGVGNDGQEPLDNMDECCKQHDGCYDAVMTSGQCQVEQTDDISILCFIVRSIFQVPHPLLSSYSWSRDSEDALVCDDCAEWVASHTFTFYLLANWEWYTEDDITVQEFS